MSEKRGISQKTNENNVTVDNDSYSRIQTELCEWSTYKPKQIFKVLWTLNGCCVRKGVYFHNIIYGFDRL